MRRSATILAAMMMATLFLPAAVAAKSSPASPAPLTLLQEVWTYSSNPTAPANCLNEDDSHYRNWGGGLAGSFTATEQLCDYATDGWSAGGIGLQADVSLVGSLTSLSITSPDGVSVPAVLTGQAKLKGGAVQQTYEVCVMPLFYLSSNTGTDPLPGGTWTFTLSGSASSVSYEVRAIMGYPDVQTAYCPSSEQNLAP